MPASSKFVLSAPLLLSLVACNQVETGVNGQLEFVPDRCGMYGCDLDDRLAVGAATEITVQAIGGATVGGIELISSDHSVFDVIGRDGFDDDTYVIEGTGAGWADLIAVDRAGNEIDYIPIEIAWADDVEISIYGDSVSGPYPIGDSTDHYEALTGTQLTLTARPAASSGPLMGETPFDVYLDDELAANIDDGDELALGNVTLTVPADGHLLTFVAPGGAVRTVELVGL